MPFLCCGPAKDSKEVDAGYESAEPPTAAKEDPPAAALQEYKAEDPEPEKKEEYPPKEEEKKEPEYEAKKEDDVIQSSYNADAEDEKSDEKSSEGEEYVPPANPPQRKSSLKGAGTESDNRPSGQQRLSFNENQIAADAAIAAEASAEERARRPSLVEANTEAWPKDYRPDVAKSPTEEVAEAEASGEIAYEGGGEAEAEASRPQYTPEEAEAKNGEEVEIEGYEG